MNDDQDIHKARVFVFLAAKAPFHTEHDLKRVVLKLFPIGAVMNAIQLAPCGKGSATLTGSDGSAPPHQRYERLRWMNPYSSLHQTRMTMSLGSP